MPRALVNGVRLNYVQMESSSVEAKPDLVMVHGLATNMAFWYFQYAAQLSQRYRVTLFDMRGHGRSDMPADGYSPQNLGQDLKCLLDHLAIDRAHFLVHSFGGVVTLNMACSNPERVASLVLADTQISAARSDESSRRWGYGDRIQKLLDASGIELDTRSPHFGYHLLTKVALMHLSNEKVPVGIEALVGPLTGKHGNRTAAQWLTLMDCTSAIRELLGDDGLPLEALRRLRFPILAMYGDNSQARLTGEELLNVWPHAEFRRVRDAGHFFPTSRPAEVMRTTELFWAGELDRLPKQRSGESERRHFRSDRIYETEGAWYFLTREEARHGPYASAREAHSRLHSYIRSVALAMPSQLNG